MKRLRLLPVIRRASAIIATAGLFSMVLAPALAGAQAVVQSYTAGSGVQLGMLVQLGGSKQTVVPAVSDQADKTLGVVVSPTDAPLAVAADVSSQQVYVASANNYGLLVSDQAGSIAKGDYLTVSALSGVAMKADQHDSFVVAKALADFDGSGSASSTNLQDSAGASHQVHLGQIPAALGIGRNPAFKEDAVPSNGVPNFLRRATQTIAGHPISATRIYLSGAVLLVILVIVGSLLYSAVRNGLISIGRNPLAKSTITDKLLQVCLIAGIVLVVGLGAIYLLLRL